MPHFGQWKPIGLDAAPKEPAIEVDDGIHPKQSGEIAVI